MKEGTVQFKSYAVHLTAGDVEYLMVVSSKFWARFEIAHKVIENFRKFNPELEIPNTLAKEDSDKYLDENFQSWWYASEDE